MTHPAPRRLAFTLIELLVVISVIAILSGIILAAVGIVSEHAKVNKSRAILNGATVGLATTAMRTNVNVSPVEHPLARTLEPRYAFARGETIGGSITEGGSVDTAGEALMARDASTVAASEQGRLMLASDHWCGGTLPRDTDQPMLFGLQRRYLSVLGTGYGLHHVRRLPAVSPVNDRNSDLVLDNPPYLDNPGTGVAYPNTVDTAPGNLADATLFEIEQKKLYDFMFGPEVLSELTALEGIRTADSASGALIRDNLLRTVGSPSATWDQSTVRARKAPLVRDTDGQWKPYRLRGPGLYDAWGREIIAYLAANGSLVLESAGKDGLFCWHPGANAAFDTDPWLETAAGDDRDASRDNLRTGER